MEFPSYDKEELSNNYVFSYLMCVRIEGLLVE